MDLLAAAFTEARGLDHWWAGTEHMLLALIATPPVGEVLHSVGVTRSAVLELINDELRDAPHSPGHAADQIRLAPAAYTAAGRARGYGIAGGRHDPDAVDCLVGVVYDDNSMYWRLKRLGTSPREVLDQAQRAGLAVPEIRPDEPQPMRGARSIAVSEDELDALIAALGRDHPPGSQWRWGFNWITTQEPRRGVVTSEEGIDLDAVLRDVRAGTGDGAP